MVVGPTTTDQCRHIPGFDYILVSDSCAILDKKAWEIIFLRPVCFWLRESGGLQPRYSIVLVLTVEKNDATLLILLTRYGQNMLINFVRRLEACAGQKPFLRID